jgi:predicted MPP superfamily phosphohydrolase
MLTYDQLIPALIFIAFVALVYVIAIRNLMVSIWNWYRKTNAAARPSGWKHKLPGILALVGLGCFAYGYAIEPYWPEVARVALNSSKMAPGARPVRIVHISDVHSDPAPRLEVRLPQIIGDEKPDLILFSGDAANSPAGVPVFRALLARLATIAPTYAVKGNWDAFGAGGASIFEGTGAHELTGAGTMITAGPTRIWLTGVSVSRAYDIPAILAHAPNDVFSVFLYHYPDEVDLVSGKVDLYCAGHTHGGQVALPVYGALITLSRYGKRFESGLFDLGQTTLYVNRGIGMEGGLAPRVRFFARPEVTVYEIGPRPGTP